MRFGLRAGGMNRKYCMNLAKNKSGGAQSPAGFLFCDKSA